MDSQRLSGKIKKYFRTRLYGFIELDDKTAKEECKDVFFHLDHIPSNVPLEKIVIDQRVTIQLKRAKEGRWVAESLELIEETKMTEMAPAHTLQATEETDALLRVQEFNRGLKAKMEDLGTGACPWHPDSLTAKWWFDGYNSLEK